MALPTITFNSGTGSDTAASGSVPATAITAGGNNGASTSAASAVVDLSADAPDLSTITAGESVLWVDSSSGRQFSAIASFDNTAKTVTCDDTFANTESGRNWGIGGKRATIGDADSRTLFGSSGAKAGWCVVLEDDQSISTVLVVAANITIKGDSESSHRQILQTGNTQVTNPQTMVRWKNIKFAHSNATKTSAYAFNCTGTTAFQTAVNCIFGDATNTLLTVINRGASTPGLHAENCEICYLTDALRLDNLNFWLFDLVSCWIHDNASHGFSWTADASCPPHLIDCIIEDNGGDGINVTTTSVDQLQIRNCTIDGNAGDGIDLSTASTGTNAVIINNNITNNTGWGINGHSTLDTIIGYHDYNNYGTTGSNNSSGARNNLTAGPNDLAVDPGYTNAGSNNFSVGTNVKAKAYPVGGTHYLGANQSTTYSYKDLGASQRQETGGGSGPVPKFGPSGEGPSFKGVLA